MEIFKCKHCGNILYFENTSCVKCGYPLGFETEQLQLFPVVDWQNGTYTLYNKPTKIYRYCINHQYNVCNWLVEEGSKTPYCKACDLNSTIPNLSQPDAIGHWHTIENAKHRLIYSLLKMKLPLMSKKEDREKGLTFDFLADLQGKPRVLTGHDNGLITLNIIEADDVEREKFRKAMKEPYRALIGHFRHEVGHYYWDRLIDNSKYLDECRVLFGDDRLDYAEALQKHYSQGAPAYWNLHFISSYASSHPWEDWAETWAHYLHIMDTLQTGYSFGLALHPQIAEPADFMDIVEQDDPYKLINFNQIIAKWLPMSIAMNSINRSMGHTDLYPFVITAEVMKKLSFIHKVCYESREV
ncbi:MAG: zinc-binding metallopeptidase family protein [Janthinobacterium lividum]